MSKLFAMAIPITKGKEAEWDSFVKELNGNRKKDFDESRRRLGLRERTFLQKTPTGNLVLVTLEGEDPEKAFRQLAGQTDEFTKWFVARVKDLHDLDLTHMPEQSMVKQVVDSGALKEVTM